MRSSDAEPEADADAWYRSYGYPMNYNNWNMYRNNWAMYNNNWNNWNMYYNRPSYTQRYYHKRSADAEADADAWYQPYGYSYSNYYNGNWNMYNNWNDLTPSSTATDTTTRPAASKKRRPNGNS